MEATSIGDIYGLCTPIMENQTEKTMENEMEIRE